MSVKVAQAAADKTAAQTGFKAKEDNSSKIGQKKQMLDDMKAKEDKAKQDKEDERNRAQLEIKQKMGPKAMRNVIMPQYHEDERLKVQVEFDGPPSSLFLGCGWDRKPNAGQRHYRKYYQ